MARRAATAEQKAKAVAAQKLFRARHPERVAAFKKKYKAARGDKAAQLKRRYGLLLEQFDAMLEAQGGSCAICRSASTGFAGRGWSVDHDHATGKVRGLLCAPCNVALGSFRDNPVALRSAALYVEAHQ